MLKKRKALCPLKITHLYDLHDLYNDNLCFKYNIYNILKKESIPEKQVGGGQNIAGTPTSVVFCSLFKGWMDRLYKSET